MTHPHHATVDAFPQALLRILETTDLHVHIMPYDYFSDRPDPGTGLAHTATRIHQARASATNSVLFDNGDFLQGNLMSDWAAAQPRGAPHPMIQAMNTLDYDAGTLGNHEFNYGLGLLQNTMSQANFPFVCANITTPDGALLIAPWRILERTITDTNGTAHTLKIGVIGFAPPQTGLWDRYTKGSEIAAHDIIDAAQTQVPLLRAAGADIVIALCHSGIGDTDHTENMENAAIPLAAVAGIDVLLTGHTHRRFPLPDGPRIGPMDARDGALHGKPAVMAGFHGTYLGQIDLTLAKTHDGWTSIAHTSAALPTDRTKPDAAVINSVAHAHKQTLHMIRMPLANTSKPVFSYFATVAPAASLTILADAMRHAGEAALAGSEHADLPLLCAVAPYTAGGWNRPNAYVDIPAGPFAVRHAAELYPFPNDLCLLALTGADIRLWLERSAHAFHQITPGAHNQPLFDPDFPAYDFDVIHGLRYDINVSQPNGKRIQNLTLADGSPLAPDAWVVVAANGYRAAGGGGFHMAGHAEPLVHQTRPLRDILIDDLRAKHTAAPFAEKVWSFSALPDTSAWFESGAGGLAYLSQPLHAHLAADRAGRNGQHRFICRFP